jgi:hypothetical protein
VEQPPEPVFEQGPDHVGVVSFADIALENGFFQGWLLLLEMEGSGAVS